MSVPQAVEEFLQIVREDTLTKAQMEEKQDAWSVRQPQNVQQQYRSFKESIRIQRETFEQQQRARANALTPEARKVYNRIQVSIKSVAINSHLGSHQNQENHPSRGDTKN
jgi:hypothetical protein